jgi:hypothetical protein
MSDSRAKGFGDVSVELDAILSECAKALQAKYGNAEAA